MDQNNRIDTTVDWRENAFDLTRGIAAYTRSDLVGRLAKVIARHPEADIANAFNHKQVACKMWAREELFKVCGGRFGTIWVLGGWYGVMAAMLFDDLRFEIDEIDSIDIDADVAKVAATLNEGESRFHASTRDMYVLDYVDAKPELIINTSCEHIADVRGWLRLLPKGTKVLLQSNDYFAEPTHISCVTSQETFEALAGLEDVWFSGTLAQKKYNRFMLIGAV